MKLLSAFHKKDYFEPVSKNYTRSCTSAWILAFGEEKIMLPCQNMQILYPAGSDSQLTDVMLQSVRKIMHGCTRLYNSDPPFFVCFHFSKNKNHPAIMLVETKKKMT
jgi:hypothetical protein